jgi:putative acyl-CoA dehydrogenase
MPSRFDTHEVVNQSPPYRDVDLFSSDRPLMDAVSARGGGAEIAELSSFGRQWGAAAMFGLGEQANQCVPQLEAFDSSGFRRDTVTFHPAYHELMRHSTAAGLQASTWSLEATPAGAPAEVVRAARFYMAAQVETGHLCPITMTRAAVAALMAEPKLADQLLPGILSRDYDRAFRPWWQKTGITVGMGMTEKQGGTDVGANTSKAVPLAEGYAITGHKWFMSAPMGDAFLVLAQARQGLTCFLLPRFRPDGSVNGLRLQRLKDKLGNRSNASAEAEFADAFAWRVGAEGRGVRTILKMVQLTRLDCAIASAGLMRMALVQALHHARHRYAFQKPLAAQPLMRRVLADMALTVEAALALTMRLCRAFDLATVDAGEAARARLLTPVLKYWVCKSAPALICEAMECFGGNGYVEAGLMPRLYREAPVNAIWEGAGNVMCLDVLRAFGGDGVVARAVFAALAEEGQGLPGVAEAIAFAADALDKPEVEARARLVVEQLALAAAAAALRGSVPDQIAETFARTRLVEFRGAMAGACDISDQAVTELLERALPG